ncbi:ABC transporter [Nitratireductor indicus C115]|uniref:ABC transporter n=1 Tax=Nitratireductor indicus C115 TaxID=1231190 RepID=K2NRB5_9HYPH|nr:ABC transporter [Nitratireductor indicus C115]SFQ77434.1 branched-chain amino acid transport system ATP-binding protein [Nitratireductor indicus]
MASLTPLLITRDLCRSFGGLRAVDQVDFSLPEGETHAIIGPNGAGKTTFVSLICGRVAPTSGSVVFDGTDISRMPAHKRVRAGIAYTFQITSVFANLSAFDNVALAVQRRLIDDHERGLTSRALVEHGMDALHKVGLAALADKVAGNLSYGHQRLLEVAMGLALKPRLLILDEPTQGLSDSEIENFISLVRQIGEEATVLLIEHNMDVVMALAQRITVMEQGRVLAQGGPAEIRANPAVQQAYLGG